MAEHVEYFIFANKFSYRVVIYSDVPEHVSISRSTVDNVGRTTGPVVVPRDTMERLMWVEVIAHELLRRRAEIETSETDFY